MRDRSLKISDVQYRMVCDLLRQHCGLDFGESSRTLVERRIQKRLASLDLSSMASYLLRLRRGGNGEELGELVDVLTTNETYFLRERNQLRALSEEILPEMLERKRTQGDPSPLNIWSAGCSSGEEPCTVVMLALEAGLDPQKDIRVHASDISRAMLTKARTGIYREASFREMPEELRSRYFEAVEGGHRIDDSVKRCVDYFHLNLLDPSRMALLGQMDVILCRNVMIYFDIPSKQPVLETFYNKLRPGGYLLLGHSESLVHLSNAFVLAHLQNDLVYQRPVDGEGRGDAWHRLARTALETETSGGNF